MGKQEFLQIRMSEEEKNELTELVGSLENPDMTVSRFVRDAIRKEMASLRRKFDRQAETQTAGVGA